MTSDHSTPRCLRCPDTALRLIDRGAFAVSRDAAPLPAAIRDSALTVEVWVCPICRRIELCYPEELPLPEPPDYGNSCKVREGITDWRLTTMWMNVTILRKRLVPPAAI